MTAAELELIRLKNELADERNRATRFRSLVAFMRQAQKAYFKTRSRADLLPARDYEQKVDSMLERMTTPGLFDGGNDGKT